MSESAEPLVATLLGKAEAARLAAAEHALPALPPPCSAARCSAYDRLIRPRQPPLPFAVSPPCDFAGLPPAKRCALRLLEAGLQTLHKLVQVGAARCCRRRHLHDVLDCRGQSERPGCLPARHTCVLCKPLEFKATTRRCTTSNTVVSE